MTTEESAFNLDFDLHLLRPPGATLSEYVFCFILLNTILLFAYYNRKRKSTELSIWIIVVIFCTYAFYDTDYFTFGQDFVHGLKDFRDPLYMYISQISFGSYTLFRLYIWGTAIFLIYKLFKKFSVPPNYAIYIFSSFFLLTFAYARASLGMSLYFYGLSFIIFNKYRKPTNILIGSFFFIIAFLAHRSMALLILLTPVIYIKLNRKTIILIIIATIILFVLKNSFIDIIYNHLDDSSSVGKTANRYKSFDAEIEMNWKFRLTSYLNKATFIIATLYLFIKYFNRIIRKNCSVQIKQIFNITLVTFLISITFLSSDSQGLYVIGYRFLYMTGIPLCLTISYLYYNNIIEKKKVYWLLICPVLYSESFIAGKILSLSNIL